MASNHSQIWQQIAESFWALAATIFHWLYMTQKYILEEKLEAFHGMKITGGGCYSYACTAEFNPCSFYSHGALQRKQKEENSQASLHPKIQILA